MAGSITKALISQKIAESARTGRAIFFWEDGLGCRVSPKGRVSWLIKAYLGQGGRGAQQVMHRFGRYPGISIEAARLKAGALRVQISEGIHLGVERRKERRKQHTVFQSGKLSDAFMTYAKLHRKPKGNYWIDLAGKPDVDDEGKPVLGGTFKRIVDALGNDTLVGNVTASDIRGLIREKQAEGKKGAARSLFAALSPFFKWAKSEELISVNPMADLKAPKTVQSRERCLTVDEIKNFWRATGELQPLGPCFRLLLLTAQRRDEVAGMEWRELDLSTATWTIPGSRTKNGKEHLVHLSPQALKILADLPRPAGSKLVFRSSVRKSETKISGFSDAKEELDRVMGIDDQSAWRTHDLRRTFVTIANDRKLTQPHVIEAAINHLTGAAKAGVAGVYNRAAYLDERRELFDAWGEYIDTLVNPRPQQAVSPSNVISMRT
jgi:integrase